MRRLVEELRALGYAYMEASGKAKWDHRASFQQGTAQGLLHAAGRLEERLDGWEKLEEALKLEADDESRS